MDLTQILLLDCLFDIVLKNFDKQFVRDYLETLNWDKTPPGPELPRDIVVKTTEKYLQGYRLITGKEISQE